ncbi:MAG: hypothetical protein PVI90_16915 [Desulfobacteraceae bacterium]
MISLSKAWILRDDFTARNPFQIAVKSAPTPPHHLAQNRDGISPHLLSDKAVSQFDYLAKKAEAFFNISRSMVSR